MRAVAMRAFGSAPELMELPRPSPGAKEVLVRLDAAGVNPYDWKLADGMLKGEVPYAFPCILGVDGSGTVEEVGLEVTRYRPGDPVYGQFFHPPVGTGTYAEFVAAPETVGISRRPAGLDPIDAAGAPTPGMTALLCLDTLALSPRKSLLIAGAAGGVGSMVLQLAHRAGVETLAAARSTHRAFLAGLGASRTYDLAAPDFYDEVRRDFPNGVDGLLHVATRGSDTDRLLGLVRPGGVAVSTFGAMSDTIGDKYRVRAVNVNTPASRELMDRLSEALGAGGVKIPVDQRVRLEQGAEALAQSRAGTAHGKTVIVVRPE